MSYSTDLARADTAPVVSSVKGAPLAFLYENPQWLIPIFAELARRGIAYDRIFIPEHFYEIGRHQQDFKVLFNRMSPSANSRQHGSGIFHTLAYRLQQGAALRTGWDSRAGSGTGRPLQGGGG
jgi:hypothetical protein